MKKQWLCIVVIACLGINKNLFAQDKVPVQLDEVVVTATKFALKKEKVGKVIHKITQAELVEQAGRTVFEVLNTLPGIEIKGANSVLGEPRGIYMRGARNRQVLILIDGVPVSDPTGVEQSYDLRLLSLNMIESIEVLKGASSTLYGTGAGAGVINIILKKASKDSVSGSLETSLGTNKTVNNTSEGLHQQNLNAAIHGASGDLSYSAFFNLTGVDGISAAKSKTAIVFEDDAYNSKNGFLKLGYQKNNFSVEAFLNYDQFDYDYDAGAYFDSEINTGKQRQLRFGIKPKYTYDKGEVYVLASINDLDRSFDSYNSRISSVNVFEYLGKSLNIDVVNRYKVSDKIQLITGINYQKHENETLTDFGTIDPNLANFNVVDPYVSLVYVDSRFSFNAGSRLNIHSNYGNHFVYDANASYKVADNGADGVRLLASYSTAFIAPSLYQLFSQYGNVGLNPEANKTFETGVNVWLGDKLQFNAVYFDRNEQDKVIFKSLSAAPWGVYDNALTDTQVNGVELDANYTFSDKIRTNVAYTYTNKDKDVDYIPKNKFVAGLEVQATKQFAFNTLFRSVGERSYFDTYGSFGNAGEDVILPSYKVFDIHTSYKLLNDKVTFFANVTNLFNEDYEETLGYNTRGRNYQLGVRLQF